MRIITRPLNRGGALTLTLLTALVIGFTLASYLSLVSSQNASTMRALAWNHAVPVAEAGVEEALTQLHYTGITNLLANDWTRVDTGDTGLYYKRRDVGHGSYFEVGIKPVEPPVIISFGYVPAPLRPVSQAAMILGLGTDTAPTPGAYLKRKVRIHTKRDPFFSKAMLAKGQINLNGNNVGTDSFDSTKSEYNTNGKYDPDKARDHGDVATISGLIDSLDVGNASVKGKVSTGPNGTVDVGSNGSVGEKWWVEGGKKGIQPGYVSDDMNIDIPDVEMPPGAPITTPSGNYPLPDGTNYNYVLSTPPPGRYLTTSQLNGKIYVTGDVTLLVTDQINITGQDYIYLAPGATLKLYVAAPSANLSGQGIINPGSALNFQYLGLNSNTSLSFGGNSAFTGSIYAPYAAFTLNGSGNDTYDFVGASVTSTVNMNGNFNFHYDEALAKLGPLHDYVVTAWNEVSPDSWD